jgi:predicted acylesterase/phospholipase RssA
MRGAKQILSVSDPTGAKTAFVFAGGGSFGAIQVGMMHSLTAHGISADMVVGSSVGAINGAYYAGDPTLKGVQQLERVWRGLQRHDVFPITWRTLLGFVWRRDFSSRMTASASWWTITSPIASWRRRNCRCTSLRPTSSRATAW